MRAIRALFLMSVSLGLLTLAGFVMTQSVLTLPAALAGVSTFALALV
jgi:hypothetical protein